MNKLGMKVLGAGVSALTAVCFSVNSAKADNLPEWYTGVGAGYHWFEGDHVVQGSTDIDIKVGYNYSKQFAVEGTLGALTNVVRNFNSPGSSHIDENPFGVKFALDAIYHLDELEAGAIVPYVSAGAGTFLYNKDVEDGSADPFVSAGLGVTYQVDENLFIRPDYRFSNALKNSRQDHTALLTVGYRFGAPIGSGGSSNEGLDPNGGKSPYKPVYFGFDSSKLDKNAQETIKSNAEVLKQNPSHKVTLAGHCDERGTTEYNLALGERRAKSVQSYLKNIEISTERVEGVISYGEEFPADAAHNEAAWSKNRRTEFVLPKK